MEISIKVHSGTEGIYLPGETRVDLWDLEAKSGLSKSKLVRIGLLALFKLVKLGDPELKQTILELEQTLSKK